MLEVLMVTGPLGSGKTTVVNRLLKAELARGSRVAVLINEFGAVSVDGLLVDADRPELADIANLVDGCACCSLRADVVAILAGWCDLPAGSRPAAGGAGNHRAGGPHRPGGPGPGTAPGRPHAPGRLHHRGLGPAPLDHLAQRPLLRRQTALASLVYVSKADLDPSLAMAWESQIRAAFPGHPIRASRMGVAADRRRPLERGPCPRPGRAGRRPGRRRSPPPGP